MVPDPSREPSGFLRRRAAHLASRLVEPWPALLLAILVGVAHAAAIYWVALSLGYPVGLADYGVAGLLWRYGGLAVAGAIPTYLLVRYRVVAPTLALLGVAGYVVGAELAPPGPVFETVHGVLVVEDGLYAVKYARSWYAWAALSAFAGVAEYGARGSLSLLPAPPVLVGGRELPLTREPALAAAGSLGLVHAAAIVPYAFAVHVSNLTPPVVAWIALGAVALAGAVGYLLVRHRLQAPFALFVLNLLAVLRADFRPAVDGPVPLYVVGWSAFLGVFLAAGAVEYGLRAAGRRFRAGGATAG